MNFNSVIGTAVQKNRDRISCEKTLARYQAAWVNWDLDCDIATRLFRETAGNPDEFESIASIVQSNLVEIADCLALLGWESYPNLAIESYHTSEPSLEGHSGELLNRSAMVVLAAVAAVIDDRSQAESVARTLLSNSSELELSCGHVATTVIATGAREHFAPAAK